MSRREWRSFAALLVAVSAFCASGPAFALSVCPGATGSVRGDGPYPDYQDAPLEPVLWARVCDSLAATRSVSSKLVGGAPSTLHPLQLPLALIEQGESATMPARYLGGSVARAPGFTEPVYRIELEQGLKPASTYQLVAYDRNFPDPEVHEIQLSSFRTQQDDRPFDGTIALHWPGPTGYSSRELELGNFDWTEHRLAMGPMGRVPPLFRVDYMGEVSLWATPILSDLLIPNREGNAFQGFECGCGRALEAHDDEEKGIHWMRLTPVTPDGHPGPVFWARVTDGKLETFPDRELSSRVAGPLAIQFAFPLVALVALVVWWVRFRKPRVKRSGA